MYGVTPFSRGEKPCVQDCVVKNLTLPKERPGLALSSSGGTAKLSDSFVCLGQSLRLGVEDSRHPPEGLETDQAKSSK